MCVGLVRVRAASANASGNLELALTLFAAKQAGSDLIGDQSRANSRAKKRTLGCRGVTLVEERWVSALPL